MRTVGKAGTRNAAEIRNAQILPVEEEWLGEVLDLAELYVQEGEVASWSLALVKASRRVAAQHKTMPGPLLAALEGRKRKRFKEDGKQEEEG